MKLDVLIVGAGPAGGMAAGRLASTGLKVMILEKQKLPRHKPCGGGLSVSARQLLPWDLSPVIEAQVSGVESLYNYSRPHFSPAASMLMVNRSRFDAYLTEQAISSSLEA